MILRSSEWVALLYFSSLTLTAFLLRVPVPIRRGVASIAATLSVVILVLATMVPQEEAGRSARQSSRAIVRLSG